MEGDGDAGHRLLVVGGDPEGTRMTFGGIHPHRRNKVTVLLAKLTARGDGIILDHICALREADTHDALLAGLGEANRIGGASDTPFGLVQFAGIEIIREHETAARTGVGGVQGNRREE